MSFITNLLNGRTRSIVEMISPVVELRKTQNGIFYIMIDGREQPNSLTMDINLANRLYEIAVGEYKNNKDEDFIIRSNVETR